LTAAHHDPGAGPGSGAWKTACIAAGVPNLEYHDLRRTAVRNMRRAGVLQVVRMKITGHKTTSIEQRYNITDVEGIRLAAEMMEKFGQKK
jgi:integrase